jgi:hypothetical protein
LAIPEMEKIEKISTLKFEKNGHTTRKKWKKLKYAMKM